VLGSVNHLQSSLISADKVGTNLSGARGFDSRDRIIALSSNIRLEWKRLKVSDPLANRDT
jgi:hypothetical protein